MLRLTGPRFSAAIQTFVDNATEMANDSSASVSRHPTSLPVSFLLQRCAQMSTVGNGILIYETRLFIFRCWPACGGWLGLLDTTVRKLIAVAAMTGSLVRVSPTAKLSTATTKPFIVIMNNHFNCSHYNK